MHGFFQTEKYFKHIEDEVREDLSFKDEIVETCEDIMGQFDNPISLHVRRGDFIHNSSRHPVLHANYYKKALEMFDDDRQVIIFTNDVEWCKEHPLFEDDRFAVAEGGNQFYDMCLMSMCSDFITANSSFSWWGAWLGNKGKVVCPSGWFGPDLKDNNTEDLFCEDWVVV